jgi:hypothetical protein
MSFKLMRRASSVDEYISLGGKWQESLQLLRELMQSTRLTEKEESMPNTWVVPYGRRPGSNAFKKSSP